ncbi:putative RNA pol II promoter Fmp27 protein [Lyophyllum shimeji]|uniref:RNA pol II promoter Fmp27 protein n=1 Tax=Lyophyllum shimeji TaxID=47721 RepID=A0A9P3UJY9_LYOSH|nr:putative RNA pol II promoter Fmp27 protein [Lyophyllum shimeji]
MAHRLWNLVSSAYALVEPFFRPLIRTWVVAGLRLLIRWLPHVISALKFEAHSSTFTFPELPGTRISAEKLTLHADLSFTELEKAVDTKDHIKMPRSSRSKRSYGVVAWRRRLTASFKRTLDRAWGMAQGQAAISINLHNIGGSTQSVTDSGGREVQFLRLPGAIDFRASMGFSPREGTADAHSLEVSLKIGDCTLETDTLKLLSQSLKPRESVLEPNGKKVPASPMLYPDSPIASPSPAYSETLFSPQSSVMSPGTDDSLSALLSPEVMSPASPSSPFLEVLSASIRPRRRHVHVPRTRLKDIKDPSILSVLHHANVEVAAVTFVTQRRWGADPYELKIQDIAVKTNVCNDSSEEVFHKHWLGRGRKVESYDSDAYNLKLSIRRISLDRRTRLDTMRLLTLEAADFQALATQWPAPWLTPSPFISGDPNTPLLAIRGELGGMELTERLERLRELAALAEPSVKGNPSQPTAPSSSLNLPRFAFELRCGPLIGRIICADTKGSEPFAVELRNNGLVISAESSFGQERRVNARQQPPDHERSLRMDYTFVFMLDPTLVRIRSKTKMDSRHFTRLRSFDADFLDDPSILSIEAIEVVGEGHAVASMEQDSESVASVVPSSSILDIQMSSDALCIEVWNPSVIVAIHQLISILPTQEDRVASPAPSKALLDRLPAGISVTMAIGRFVVFVTSPDINPQDTLDLSRGFACRTGLSMHYSSMHSGHAHRFQDLPRRTQTRHMLDLPQEQIVDAVSAARASTITHNASAHFRISLSDLSLRSAVATEYDADNPLIFEKDGSDFIHLECLRVPSMKVDLCLSGKRGTVLSKAGDTCDVSVMVPDVRATFQLSHVYSVMLAIHGLNSILPNPPRRTMDRSSPLVYRTKVVVTTLQVLCVLRTQSVALRMDGIETNILPDRPFSLQLSKAVAWVRLPSRINKWQSESGPKWEECVVLQTLHASVAPASGTSSISLDGESARLRIPFGYILADLIFDLTATAKAIRHLARITAQQQYSPMPPPEPEGPKVLPKITVRLRCMCLEASDDPFERKLADIWRCGLDAVKQRMEREAAFQAKVAAIYQAESEVPPSGPAEAGQEYHFGADHSVSIDEARRRLDEVHELDWTLRLQSVRQKHSKTEDAINQSLRGKLATNATSPVPNIVDVTPAARIPPLFRVLLDGVFLTLQRPSFPKGSLLDFLHEQGGLPYETGYSLLVSLHLDFTLSSLHVTLRDYPLPLFSIPPNSDRNLPAWAFDTDLVIAEEMGSEQSVCWVECPVLEQNYGALGAPALSISVPKTIMPVKTYANPVIHVATSDTTIISWGVSYTPAIQDLMRVIETLSSPPLDPSPPVGFWDKMRLIFHWSLIATFKGEVRFHMKGSRDPQKLSDEGAGFVLSWQGNTKLLVARKNEDNELLQVVSDCMLIAIPNLEHLYPRNQERLFSRRIPETSKPFRKICAEVRSGVRFGIGFVLERACGSECLKCSESAFHRQCRYFDFRPHYEVRLETKAQSPERKTSADSYNGFRSDFIHMSISLASSTRNVVPGSRHDPSSIHLTPKAFAHFWSWCGLFNSALSLPTRQGSYFPTRIVSPKFGRHLATLKYRLHVRPLFIMHAYIDESRETWADGVLPWIGVKGLIEELQADLHQRDEESVVAGPFQDTTKVLRRKPVYAAEVSLKGLDLRALLAIFREPLREAINMIAPPQRSNYRAHDDLPSTPSMSIWYDTHDFIEVDWSPSSEPKLHLLPVVTCPQFTYFKRHSVIPSNSTLASKFGDEKSHSCLLGKSLTVPQVQIEIAESRMKELRRLIRSKKSRNSDNTGSLEKMVTLLEDYVSLLSRPDSTSGDNDEKSNQSYLLPSYALSPDEWAEFENVYHIHCPKILMDSAIRDIMIQYYYCSRARKGLEYHMATRAVKFIRDQAEAVLDDESDDSGSWEYHNVSAATATAQMAASALKKMLKGDSSKPSVEISTSKEPAPSLEEFDPLEGWSEGLSLRKSHCCLLLKPQVVLRGEGSKGALVVAAVQAKLQAYTIMDDSNADDPICGKVMSRSLTSLSGLQTFAPAEMIAAENLYVPLEVLLDLRCESTAFDQLVPQTNATFLYDKFNRLRLRNNITSATRSSTDRSTTIGDSHLQDQTDLIRVHIPQFTVSASDEHFAAISHIVTHLLLFSDAAHKTRLEKLETLLFTYDFTDLVSAAQVVADLQGRLGEAIEAQKIAEYNHSRRLEEEEGQLEMLKLKAHIFLLSEELNFLFDAIKLAQDRFDDHTDQKSALLLHASSSEISWRMLDDRRDLLSKLVVQGIDFLWLSRQDSSTSNSLTVRNLQAFDGSRHALWTEILSKHDEPANHPLLKRGLFLLASWTVLAPVGGITIYESFELSLHPMRLQIDARVGRRIMEYLWPARKHRNSIEDAKKKADEPQRLAVDYRTSLDSPRALRGPNPSHESGKGELVPPLRKLGNSRSFTDLRGIAKDSLMVPTFHKLHSTETLRLDDAEGTSKRKGKATMKENDAAEMKIRTSQKSFVLVKISSMNLLLSIAKEGSFECTDARIKTRDLEYRNQTWSFEELVNQFIPSDTSWRGWVKMAFHQPLLPVLPVARELISKTKWIPSSSKTATQIDIRGPPPKLPRVRRLSIEDDANLSRAQSRHSKTRSKSAGPRWRQTSHRKLEPNITSLPLTDEPESITTEVELPNRSGGRKRMMSFFSRSSSKGNSTGSSATLPRHHRTTNSNKDVDGRYPILDLEVIGLVLMPSIRIKSSPYATLRDSPRPTPLTTLFISNAEHAAGSTTPPGSPAPPRMQRSMPALRRQASESPQEPQPHARPRSGTTSSRIQSYLIGSSRRHLRGSISDGGSLISSERAASPLSAVPHDGILTLEGPQAELLIRSNGEPGVIGSALSLPKSENDPDPFLSSDIHHDDVVEHLDVIDPQVGTVASLTNAANAILIPPQSWLSRKPVLVLTGPPPSTAVEDRELGGHREKYLQDSLDRHVDDVLRRPSKFRRTMQGVWSFLKTPMGVITAIYGFLVVFWGAAIVLFVGKLINLHNPNTQGFWVEVSSQVENALFTVTGIGLIPYRVLDTYRIYWIWHYKRKTRKLRKKAGIPQLFDEDDLPDPKYDPNYVHVLTEKDEKFLHRQQRKFQYSQTWYRPHGTETHRAFPINTALLICLLNDGNSIFQIMLCGTMWGLDRFQRPAWSTGILIPCSFLCGIAAAVFIWRGGQKTKRVAEVEERLRAALLAGDDDQTEGHPKIPASQQTPAEKTKRPRQDLESRTVVDEHMTVPRLRVEPAAS